MKALVAHGPGQLAVEHLPTPKPNQFQALTRTVSCGICAGTDQKLIDHHFKGFENYPAAIGHEAIGEVVEVGAKVTSFRPGDLVTLPFLYEPVDGVTPAWGAFAEYGLVGDAAACAAAGLTPGDPEFDTTYLAQKKIAVTPKLSAVEAAQIVTLREVYSAVRFFGLRPGQTAVIFGAGPVGLSFTRFAALTGLAEILVVDVNPAKTAAALAAGATDALDSTAADPVAWAAERVPGGVDVVIDAVGVTALASQGLAMIKDRGKVCVYGIAPTSQMNLDWSRAPYNWSLQFQQFPRKAEEGQAHAQIIDWIEAGELVLADYISHVIAFQDVLDAFALVAERRPETKKIVIAYPT
ncbi:MAG: zinc-binding dehydrogenase [Bifidobacteriaceae bacterium]|jgi:L-iditol 2-dehydrogenase/propanol-preferring alcohol dehydrogenase|nr:zinc-binding dehydrogenase [Bifidobacteriaceae bacterium]